MTIDRRTDARDRESYRARVPAKDADTGKWGSVTGSWTRNLKAAERKERELLGRRDRGALAPARGQTLGGFITGEHLPAVRRVSRRGRPLAPTTDAKYQGHAALIASVIGDVGMTDLRARHIERLRDELLRRGLAPQTVADVLRFASQALRRAVSKGIIGQNWADASTVDRPVGEVRDFTIITPEEGKRILAAARGTDPWDAGAHLALGLSLRREEVLGLGWEHVDLEARTVRIERTLTYAGGELHWGGPKSTAARRTLTAPTFVLDALRRHRAAQNERRLLYGADWRDEGLVVDYGGGGPWLPPTFSTYWARFARRSGFGEVSFHGLRHGAATLLLAGGVPDAVAISILGHADAKILRRYQEVVPELMQHAADRLEALLGDS